MSEDADLLRHYADDKAQDAFATFVQRHVNFVYGCALRRVGGDTHYAEDVTQQVFVAAARDAARLLRHPVISGWLFTTTRNVAAQLVRTEKRRQAREREAHAMQEMKAGDEGTLDWTRLRPVIDDAMDQLGETDRQAVLLRFFEGKSFAEVGERLRMTENTARMRVVRALDKLSGALGSRGVTSSTAALGLALTTHAGVIAPAGLAATATGAALAAAAAGTTTTAAVFLGMTKLQLGLTSAVVMAGIAGYTVQSQAEREYRARLAELARPAAEVAAVVEENQRLIRSERDTDDLAKARVAELAELQRRIAATREQLQAQVKARQQAAAMAAARLTEPMGTPLLDISKVTVRPKLVASPPPKYPFAMRRFGLEGQVLVDFVVDSQGAVRNARAMNWTHQELADSAVAAIAQWNFEPGEAEGKPVAVHMQVPIVFKLDGAAKTGGHAAEQTVPWF